MTGPAVEYLIALTYDPHEARDDHGEWTLSGSKKKKKDRLAVPKGLPFKGWESMAQDLHKDRERSAKGLRRTWEGSSKKMSPAEHAAFIENLIGQAKKPKKAEVSPEERKRLAAKVKISGKGLAALGLSNVSAYDRIEHGHPEHVPSYERLFHTNMGSKIKKAVHTMRTPEPGTMDGESLSNGAAIQSAVRELTSRGVPRRAAISALRSELKSGKGPLDYTQLTKRAMVRAKAPKVGLYQKVIDKVPA